MDPAAIDKCQDLIGYRFGDRDLLALALTHSSVAPTRTQSNERLEFLGDAVLGVVVCEQLYQQCQDLMEGEMTKIKSTAVSRQTCAEIADELGLPALTVMSKGINRGRGLPQSVSAAVFESVVGAIYTDGGLDQARRFILEHVQPYIDEALANEHQRNYKSVLQQHAQRQWGAVPAYQLLDEKGPDHSKCFEVAVSIGGRNFASAWGKNKKEAEQEAALLALQELGLLSGDE
ncbi:MAG TPA: ribonuclease III [Phycisphaerae bacterium]|nr:ribonuclease III [Phycisphaerae bacterium]